MGKRMKRRLSLHSRCMLPATLGQHHRDRRSRTMALMYQSDQASLVPPLNTGLIQYPGRAAGSSHA